MLTKTKFLFVLGVTLGVQITHAGIPVWSIVALTTPVINIAASQTATVQYLVTNHSRRPHLLSVQPVKGIAQDTSSGFCKAPFGLAYNESCTLKLNIIGADLSGNIISGPIICDRGNPLECYQPSQADSLKITLIDRAPVPANVTVSLPTLVLSQTGYTEYGIVGTPSSGLPRYITVSNTGDFTTEDLSINYPSWPSGTSASSTCGTSLTAGESCTITITPGANPTSACSTAPGTAPTAGTITISASNADPATTDVVVLGYGCVYQGGYVFYLDDSPPAASSVNGRVLTTTDQANPIEPNGVQWDDGDHVAIYGISNTSTPSSPSPSTGQVGGQLPCAGILDGICNSNNIYIYYQGYATGAPVDLMTYPVGLCTITISGYSDWYLPTICELGYGSDGGGANQNAGCGTLAAPTLQNVKISLFNNGIGSLLTASNAHYWSSTQGAGVTAVGDAWAMYYNAFNTFRSSKDDRVGARCVRRF